MGVHIVDFSDSKDPCFSKPDSKIQKIKFTTCSDEQFTCSDGLCIDIEERCDQTVDCDDASDERNCKLLVMEQNYNKGTPPFILDKETKTIKTANVNISVTVIDVLDIVEVKHEIELKFHLLMEWYDPRLKFHNLKPGLASNVPSELEISSLWVPSVIFSNTKNNEATYLTPDTIIAVMREGSVSHADSDVIEEVNIFEGSENRVTFQQGYAKYFKCEYQLHLYPFDTQVSQHLLEKLIKRVYYKEMYCGHGCSAV